MASSIAMIALSGPPATTVSDVVSRLQKQWPHITVADPADDEETLSFTADGQLVVAGRIRAPIPWTELEGPCATSWMFPNAAAALKPHTGHAIVTVNGDAPPFQRLRLLTQVIVALLGAWNTALGVYWPIGGMVHRPDVFAKLAVASLPAEPPLLLWIDFRVWANEDRTSSGFTCGLSHFGLMELETENASERPRALQDRLISIAGYLIDNGPVLGDGHTIGEGAEAEIRVHHALSAFGRSEQVLRLVYQTPPPSPAKPWWKLR